MEELGEETKLYEAKLPEWRSSHLGKFVLIKGASVIGFYESLQAAFAEGTTRFGLEPFFVKQIIPKDSVNVSFMGKRLKTA